MELTKKNETWNFLYLSGILLFILSFSLTGPELKSRFLPVGPLVSVSVVQKTTDQPAPLFFVRWSLRIFG